MLKILAIGDVYGEPGRKAVEMFVGPMKQKGEVDFVLCNAENAAAGCGVTDRIAKDLFQTGCDVLTCGDHVFDRLKDVENSLKEGKNMVRPANFPKGVPGHGSCVVECRGLRIGVIQVAGQVFMRHSFASPFHAADEEIAKLNQQGVKIILLDVHAEATSEKAALFWYVDGRVSAALGTHTHVQTADERLSVAGTACITDLGMTGPHDSVIGAEKTGIIKRFLTQIGSRKEVAQADIRLCGAIITVDENTGKAVAIERVQKRLG
jgi:2',3'-cyclic-nucleotide 2'-phosphodiesterase